MGEESVSRTPNSFGKLCHCQFKLDMSLAQMLYSVVFWETMPGSTILSGREARSGNFRLTKKVLLEYE